MSKQYNKTEKRQRRLAYQKRRKAATKAKKPAPAAPDATTSVATPAPTPA
jgi:hypothetical protein